MDPGSFNGEQDIDKSKIIITTHAVARFMEHIRKDMNYFNKIPRKHQNKIIGFHPLTITMNVNYCAGLLKRLLNESSHVNAANPLTRTFSVMKYKQNVFFFRYGRWQFRVIYDKGKREFVLVTAVWLDEKNYSTCFQ